MRKLREYRRGQGEKVQVLERHQPIKFEKTPSTANKPH
jgi:hypothetical protein